MRDPAAESAGALLTFRVAAVALLAPGLARLRLDRLERVLEPRRRRQPPRDATATARAVAAAVDRVLAAAPLLRRRDCLVRGITLYWFLRRAGVDVRLVFGLGENGGGVAGHCWLVRQGTPFLERVDPRPLFAETYSIPRVPRS